MGIDQTTEEVIAFAEATKLVPHRRGGKRVNVATLYRWTKTGCRGIKLEFIQIGGSRCTSREALNRFFDRLTASVAGGLKESSEARTPGQRASQSQKAFSKLRTMGVKE